MDDMNVQWEYYVELIGADARQHEQFVQQFYPPGNIPIYAVQAILPRLNDLGLIGWELINIQPVYAGNNGDVLVQGGENRYWSNAYLCSFKRVKRSSIRS